MTKNEAGAAAERNKYEKFQEHSGWEWGAFALGHRGKYYATFAETSEHKRAVVWTGLRKFFMEYDVFYYTHQHPSHSQSHEFSQRDRNAFMVWRGNESFFGVFWFTVGKKLPQTAQ